MDYLPLRKKEGKNHQLASKLVGTKSGAGGKIIHILSKVPKHTTKVYYKYSRFTSLCKAGR
jgi:hypothetical protein